MRKDDSEDTEAIIMLLDLSTDYVCDRQRGWYAKDDIPSPIDYHALVKLFREKAVITLELLIVRASTIYGFGLGRANFTRVLFENLSQGKGSMLLMTSIPFAPLAFLSW